MVSTLSLQGGKVHIYSVVVLLFHEVQCSITSKLIWYVNYY